MKRLSKLRPSPALVVALAALVAATSGAALALPGKNSVTKNDIKNGAVTTKKIAKGAVGSQQIKGKSIKGNRLKDKAVRTKQIADDAITSAQVGANALNTSDLADFKTLPMTRVTATDGVDADAARTAAPRQELFKKGQLTVYAKCYRDTTADEVFAALYIETSAAGAIVDASGGDDLNGGPVAADFLNPNTAEVDRELATTAGVAADSAEFDEGDNDAWRAFAPDGTSLNGVYSLAAKNGDLAEGNGVYGAGNVCLFGGQISG